MSFVPLKVVLFNQSVVIINYFLDCLSPDITVNMTTYQSVRRKHENILRIVLFFPLLRENILKANYSSPVFAVAVLHLKGPTHDWFSGEFPSQGDGGESVSPANISVTDTAFSQLDTAIGLHNYSVPTEPTLSLRTACNLIAKLLNLSGVWGSFHYTHHHRRPNIQISFGS